MSMGRTAVRPAAVFPLSRLAGEENAGGEGKERVPALPQRHKENRACHRDFVPDGCILTRGVGGGSVSSNVPYQVHFCPT